MIEIKKLISVGLCTLALSASSILPISAAKSADPNNSQIVNKVEMFNNSRLERLDYYIWKININNFITEDLMALYNRLDRLVVPNICVANSLAIPNNVYNANSIGSQLDLLFARLEQLDTNIKMKTSNCVLSHRLRKNVSSAVQNAKLTISKINLKIDEVENLND